MRRLTRRRQVKNRSKNSRNNKYKKTRRGKYIKKRRGVTRRRVLRGGVKVNVKFIINSIKNKDPDRFKLLVKALENDPEILMDGKLQEAYKDMIQLSPSGVPTGYLSLAGLKFLNYLWSIVKNLRKGSLRYKNLQIAISLMDQHALALGITSEQLSTIQNLSPDPYYYTCYCKLFNDLSTKMEIEVRNIPVSSSACYMNDDCNDSCNSDEECCSPNNYLID
jgi:hypothetical protein